MDAFETKLKLLIDIVTEKNTKLTQVLNITQNQETLLKIQNPEPQIAEMLRDMTLEKHALVEAVIEGDEVFNTLFEGLEDFENRAQQYKETIRALQEVVKVAADLDLNIRIAEETNKNIIASKGMEKPAIIRGGKQDLLNKYKTNYKREET